MSEKLASANHYRFIFTMRQIPVRILRYLRKTFKTLVLAYSGGTDSTLLLLIAKDYGVPIDRFLFVNTKMEFPGTLNYLRKISEVLKLELDVARPEKTAGELASIVVDDFDKMNSCSYAYDKSRYRCCYYAKEKPMRKWLQETILDSEGTCVLRGLRSSDNSTRMIHCVDLIESGQFYYYRSKQSDRAFCSNPIQLVSDELKEKWLLELCEKFKVPLPAKSGCMICPIFFKFADEEERKTERYNIARRFFSKRSKTVLDHFFHTDSVSLEQEQEVL